MVLVFEDTNLNEALILEIQRIFNLITVSKGHFFKYKILNL